MAGITYLKGDATCPQAKGVKIICHVCNDLGGWGKGFVLAISRRWPQPEADYRVWHAAGADEGFGLGAVRFVQVEPYIWVANMIGQHGVLARDGVPPVRYAAIRQALERVAAFACEHVAAVHMPRIGCGLAGGTWDAVGPIVEQTLCDSGVNVTVYDLAAAPNLK